DDVLAASSSGGLHTVHFLEHVGRQSLDAVELGIHEPLVQYGNNYASVTRRRGGFSAPRPRRSLAEIPSVYEVDLNPAVIILGSGHGLVVDRSRVGPRLGPDPVGGHAAAAQFGGHGFGPLLRQAVIQLAMRAGL